MDFIISVSSNAAQYISQYIHDNILSHKCKTAGCIVRIPIENRSEYCNAHKCLYCENSWSVDIMYNSPHHVCDQCRCIYINKNGRRCRNNVDQFVLRKEKEHDVIYRYCYHHTCYIHHKYKYECAKNNCSPNGKITTCDRVSNHPRKCYRVKEYMGYLSHDKILEEISKCKYHSMCRSCGEKKHISNMLAMYCGICCTKCAKNKNGHKCRKHEDTEDYYNKVYLLGYEKRFKGARREGLDINKEDDDQ
jgi:hypothetical protein